MFRVSKSLGWGFFSLVLWRCSRRIPLCHKGGEFSILGAHARRPGLAQHFPPPSAGVIVCQDNVVDKNGAGIRGAMLGAGLQAGAAFAPTRPPPATNSIPRVQLLADNNMITVWQSSVAGTPGIYARLAKGGTRPRPPTLTAPIFTPSIPGSTLTPKTSRLIPPWRPCPTAARSSPGPAWPGWKHVGGFCPQDQQQRRLFPAKEFKSTNTPSPTSANPPSPPWPTANTSSCWISEQERFYNSVDVYARVFTAAGAPVTDEIAVNSGTYPCDTPDVAPLNDGGFTVVWAQKDLEVATNSWDVWGRAFSASGSPEVADFRINTFCSAINTGPRSRPVPPAAWWCGPVWVRTARAKAFWPLFAGWNRSFGQ
jgi:hypothetical protein